MHIDWMSTSIAYVYTYTYIYHEYVHRHVQVNVTQQYRTFLALHPPADRKLLPTVVEIANEHPVRAQSTAMITTPAAKHTGRCTSRSYSPRKYNPVHELRQMNMYLN